MNKKDIGRAFIYLDAYSGEIKSAPIPYNSGFLAAVNDLHARLFLGKNGGIFVGITAIAAIGILLSGFLIYKKFWLNLARLNFKKLMPFMRDSHRLIGILITPIMLAICVSGAWWELRSIFFKPNHLALRLAGGGTLSLDALLERLDLKEFHPVFIRMPQDGIARIYGTRSDQSMLQSDFSSYIAFNSDSGEILERVYIDEAGFAAKFQDSFRKAHAGSYGTLSKFIWFLAGLAPLFLCISGFI